MSGSVLKFLVGEPDQFGFALVEMPYGSEPLSVGVQDGEMVLWAYVYPGTPSVNYPLVVVKTGQDAPDLGQFLGTVTTDNGIVHVWESGRRFL